MSKQATVSGQSGSKRSGNSHGLLRRLGAVVLVAWVAWACSGKAGDDGPGDAKGGSSSGSTSTGGRLNSGGRASGGRASGGSGGVEIGGAPDAGSVGDEGGTTARGGAGGKPSGGGGQSAAGTGTLGSGGAGFVPSGWTCDSKRYRDGTCDCGCGSIDGDCADQSRSSCKRCDSTGSCAKVCSEISEMFSGACRPPPIPLNWTCSDQKYKDGVCDCGCGVVDPDCADASVTSCQRCDPFGSCSLHSCPSIIQPADNSQCISIPGWTCEPNAYGTKDGCDCGCGVLDPDCKNATTASCDYCSGKGACSGSCPGALDPKNNAVCVIPTGWTCNAKVYGDGSCDCGCGIVDVDCQNAKATSCEHCGGEGSCTGSESLWDCPNNIDLADNSKCSGPPAAWTCRARFWADGAICNCGCGVRDPDCKDSKATSCDQCNLTGSCSVQDCPGVIAPDNNDTCSQPEPPKEWKCDPGYYGGGFGSSCECGCGAFDPDCVDATAASCTYCNAPGSCSLRECMGGDIDPANNALCVNRAPSGWTCDPNLYGDQACDCGCGVIDKDCADATISKCKFCNDAGSCSTMRCPGTISATNNATCG